LAGLAVLFSLDNNYSLGLGKARIGDSLLMPRFILINETTRHACHVTTDEIRSLVDVKTNPGGYSDVDQCMAMIMHPDGGLLNPNRAYQAFPLTGPMGQMTIHVEGRMDFHADKQLRWKEPGHRCELSCLLQP
jgi:hypothetical protein